MKIFFAGFGHSLREDDAFLEICRETTVRFLISYIYLVREFVEWRWFKSPARMDWIAETKTEGTMKTELFLDSGAYSAFTNDVEIKLTEYIQFIKDNDETIDVYSNLDVIGDPEATWKNHVKMEKAGLDPVPVYHYGEDIKWLKKYMKKVGKGGMVALGGMVPISSQDLSYWLDTLFSDYLTDDTGMPIVKVHGFGLTSPGLMLRYPWYSVDSSSWVIKGRMGGIFVPMRRGGEWDYLRKSWNVLVSSRSTSKGDAIHIDNLPTKVRQIALDYIEEKGFVLGSSDFKQEGVGYELEENEKWTSGYPPKKDEETREVETIHEPGVANQYKHRDLINVAYFLDLEKAIPSWPWKFSMGEKGGLDL